MCRHIIYLSKIGPAPFTLIIGIENESKYIATYPCIKISTLTNLRIETKIRDEYNLSRLRQSQSKVKTYVGSKDDVIYPGSYIDVIKLIPINSAATKELIRENVDEDILILFMYELYSQNIAPVKGAYNLNGDKIAYALRLKL